MPTRRHAPTTCAGRAEGKAHTAAVRALANRWVRILYAMWLHHARYDPAIFGAAQHAHQPAAA